MFFRLTNIPTSVQNYIIKIFVEKVNIFVIIYPENILIYTNNDGDGDIAAIWYVLE